MSRTTGRAMSVSAAHALHFQIPKMEAPTPPSLLKRQHSSTSPRHLSSRPSSPGNPATFAMPRRTPVPGAVTAPSSPPRAPRSPLRASLSRGDKPRPSSPHLPTAIVVNEFEATFGAARPVATGAN